MHVSVGLLDFGSVLSGRSLDKVVALTCKCKIRFM